MEELVETTEQIPATSHFTLLKKEKKEWRGQAKANRLWKTWSCGLEWSALLTLFLLILGNLLHSEKQELSTFTLPGFGVLQKKGSSLPITKQALFPTTSAQFSRSPGFWKRRGDNKDDIFFQKSPFCWYSLSLLCCGTHSILVFIFAPLFFFSSRKESPFLFFSFPWSMLKCKPVPQSATAHKYPSVSAEALGCLSKCILTSTRMLSLPWERVMVLVPTPETEDGIWRQELGEV